MSVRACKLRRTRSGQPPEPSFRQSLPRASRNGVESRHGRFHGKDQQVVGPGKEAVARTVQPHDRLTGKTAPELAPPRGAVSGAASLINVGLCGAPCSSPRLVHPPSETPEPPRDSSNLSPNCPLNQSVESRLIREMCENRER